MFASLDAPLSAAPSPQPADSRAARLEKFRREQLIVEYLNRGVAVVEIAARMGLSEKRMRTVIQEILARRMPHPPAEFVAIQVSRLNEALLVAYSAMSPTNLKAVDQVIKIVRELDRYHGLSAVAGRRRPEPDRLTAPAEATAADGGALVCRAELALQDVEAFVFAQEAQDPPAPRKRGEGWGEGLGRLAAESHPAPHPNLLPENGEEERVIASAGDGRPENPPQTLEKIDSAPEDSLSLPGLLTRGSRGEGWPPDLIRGEGLGRLAAVESHPAPHPDLLSAGGEMGRVGASAGDARPENPLQSLEKIESAPGNGRPSDTAPPAPPDLPVVRVAVPTPTGVRIVNVRMLQNGMAAA